MMISTIITISITSSGDSVVLSINNGISKTFELFLTLAPIMCFWSGIMQIADKCSATDFISRLLSPLLRLLFGKESKNAVAMKKISMNMSANLLGMGNAATPLGIDAMSSLDRLNPNPYRATDAMCMFIVINTASIQLIPTSVIALRTQYGSASPSDILIPTIITTVCAFTVGTLSAKICAKVPLFK